MNARAALSGAMWKQYVYPPIQRYTLLDSFRLGIIWRCLQILVVIYLVKCFREDPSVVLISEEIFTHGRASVSLGEAFRKASVVDANSAICKYPFSFFYSLLPEPHITERPVGCAFLENGDEFSQTPSQVFIPTYSRQKWVEQSAGRDCERLEECCKSFSCFGAFTRMPTTFELRDKHFLTASGLQTCFCRANQSYFVKGALGVEVEISAGYSGRFEDEYVGGSTFGRTSNVDQYVLTPAKYNESTTVTSDSSSSLIDKTKVASFAIDASGELQKEGEGHTESEAHQLDQEQAHESVAKKIECDSGKEYTKMEKGTRLKKTLEGWLKYAMVAGSDASFYEKRENNISVLDAWNRVVENSANPRTATHPIYRQTGLDLEIDVQFQNKPMHRLDDTDDIIGLVKVNSFEGWSGQTTTHVQQPYDPLTGRAKYMIRDDLGVRISIRTSGTLGRWSPILAFYFVASSAIFTSIPLIIVSMFGLHCLGSAAMTIYSKTHKESCYRDTSFVISLQALAAYMAFKRNAGPREDGEVGYTKEELTRLLVKATCELEPPVNKIDMEETVENLFRLHDREERGYMTCEQLTKLLLHGEPCTLQEASGVYASKPSFLEDLFLKDWSLARLKEGTMKATKTTTRLVKSTTLVLTDGTKKAAKPTTSGGSGFFGSVARIFGTTGKAPAVHAQSDKEKDLTATKKQKR